MSIYASGDLLALALVKEEGVYVAGDCETLYCLLASPRDEGVVSGSISLLQRCFLCCGAIESDEWLALLFKPSNRGAVLVVLLTGLSC